MYEDRYHISGDSTMKTTICMLVFPVAIGTAADPQDTDGQPNRKTVRDMTGFDPWGTE